jgi:hypothetical protein
MLFHSLPIYSFPFTTGCSLTFTLDHLKVFWYTSFFPLHFLYYFLVFQFYFPRFYRLFFDLDLRKLELEGVSIYIIYVIVKLKVYAIQHHTQTHKSLHHHHQTRLPTTWNTSHDPSIHPSIHPSIGARGEQKNRLSSSCWHDIDWKEFLNSYIHAFDKLHHFPSKPMQHGYLLCSVNPQGGAIPKTKDLEEGRVGLSMVPHLGNVPPHFRFSTRWNFIMNLIHTKFIRIKGE